MAFYQISLTFTDYVLLTPQPQLGLVAEFVSWTSVGGSLLGLLARPLIKVVNICFLSRALSDNSNQLDSFWYLGKMELSEVNVSRHNRSISQLIGGSTGKVSIFRLILCFFLREWSIVCFCFETAQPCPHSIPIGSIKKKWLRECWNGWNIAKSCHGA